MSGRLSGKVAFVTGGARGIGKAISIAFATEGASVVMAGRDTDAGGEAENEIQSIGGTAKFVQADVGDADQVARAVSTTVAEFGSLTTLVNNAGGGGGQMQAPVADLDPTIWDDVLRVDLGGAFHACRNAIPHMIDAGGGSIISMGSTVSLHGQRRLPAGIAAKMAVCGLMRSVAVDYGPDRIRANTLIPGLVPHDAYAIVTQGEIGQAVLGSQSLPFFGEPSDIANAAVFLASDEARWITGAEFVVSGGISRPPDLLGMLMEQLSKLTNESQ